MTLITQVGPNFARNGGPPARDAVWSKSRRYAAGIGFINYETLIQANAKFCPRDGSGEKLGFKNREALGEGR